LANVPRVAQGIGVDTTTAFSGLATFAYAVNIATTLFSLVASYRGLLSVGYHYLSWNEIGNNLAGANSAFYGLDTGSGNTQAGISALVRA
jgi:hypothetical protein